MILQDAKAQINFGEPSTKLNNNDFQMEYIPEREGSLEDNTDCLSC